MLQTPINVTPSNGEVLTIESATSGGVYVNPPLFAYTFQGDRLSYVVAELYDRSAWSISAGDYKRCDDSVEPASGYLVNDVYNGTYHMCAIYDFSRPNANAIEGHDYMYRYRLYQCYPDGMPNAGQPLADMYYGRGKFQPFPESGGSVDSNQVYIEKALTTIVMPTYVSGGEHDGELRGGLYIEFGTTSGGVQRHLITDYNPNDGLLTFVGNKGITYSDMIGQPYKLFSNFIITPWYDFKYRAKQQMTLSVSDMAEGVKCNGTYTQANNVGLKCYQYEIYWLLGTIIEYDTSSSYAVGDIVEYQNVIYKCIQANSGGSFNANKWTTCSVDDENFPKKMLIEKGQKSFAYMAKDNFSWNIHDNEFHLNPFGDYIFNLITTTQENYTSSIAIRQYRENEYDYWTGTISNVSVDNATSTVQSGHELFECYDYTTKITFNGSSNYNYYVYRYDRNSTTPAPQRIYIGQPVIRAFSDKYEIVDYTVKNNIEYHYEVVEVPKSTGIPEKDTHLAFVKNAWDSWAIFSLIPQEDRMNKSEYKIGEEWSFISSINSGDITRNINSALHVGVASYAKTTRDNTIYESGSFTADLLTVECPSGQIKDDIERVDKWMKFISGDNPFLLKSAKGDVWVVDIVNSPSRRYDETLNPIFTNVTYEWAEVKDIEKCVIKS